MMIAACGRPAPRVATPLPTVAKVAAPAPVAKDSDETLCTRGDATACMVAARRYQAGFVVDRDLERAATLWTRACDAGLGEACMELGELRLSARDEDKAYELYERAHKLELERCRAGAPEACLVANDNGYVADDLWKEALAALDDGCRGGVAVQCRALARVYFQGLKATPRDRSRAIELHRRACDLDDAEGCATAALFADGDAERAFNEKGCLLGAGYSCRQLAEALHDKSLDPARARALYRQGCDAGDDIACSRLVEYLESNHGGKADAALAVVVRQRACLRGDASDCIALGEQAEKANDLDRARGFYAKACDEGAVVDGCVPELRVIRGTCSDADSCPALDARIAALPDSRRDIAAYLCCHDPEVPPSNPTAAVFALRDAIDTKNPDAIKPHVHPRRGLSVRVGWHAPDESGETKKVMKRDSLDLEPLDHALAFHRDRIACTKPEKGQASCRVFEGGFLATYGVVVDTGRAYVITIDEQSH